MAFICNLFFLGCVVVQRSATDGRGSMISLIAIMGLVLGMGILNPAANILTGVALFRKKALAVPAWLSISNGIFLLLQIIYLLHTLL